MPRVEEKFDESSRSAGAGGAKSISVGRITSCSFEKDIARWNHKESIHFEAAVAFEKSISVINQSGERARRRKRERERERGGEGD